MSGVPRLGQRLVLEAPLRVADGAGGHEEGWQLLGVLWGALRAGTGSAAGDPVPFGRVAWRITVRAAPEGSPQRPVAGQRLRLGARVFAILAVAERDAEGRYLTCFAREEEVSA